MKLDILGIDIREIQNRQLKILHEFDRICKKHKLNYVLCGGTAIGAVRHKGFIPWDDDIDVMLFRKDYDKFLDLAEKELGSEYFLQNHLTEKEYLNMYAKIRLNDTVFLEQLSINRNIHHGVFIDIFPVDNIPDNKLLRKIHKFQLVFMDNFRLAAEKEYIKASKSKLRKALSKILHPIAKRIVNPSFFIKMDNIAKKYKDKKTEYSSCLFGGTVRWYDSPIQAQKTSILEETVDVVFEDGLFPIPKNYHKYLSDIFGDYMEFPPKDMQRSQHNVIKVELNDK